MLTNYAVSGKSTKEIIEVDDNSDDEAPVPLPEGDTPVATPDIEMIDIPDGEAPDNEEEDMPKGVPERKSPEELCQMSLCRMSCRLMRPFSCQRECRFLRI